ncbi:S-layer homology domain-containing protein [Candidatus Agathobaculum pullicola]|uniref:S-layer homology domain-containing protein n=1 Tax=Candidatus Agathobaculum pullicola TaxID=2838426 RepID=UPI003F8F09C7
MRADKKLWTAVILLPITILIMAAAIASSLLTASAAGNIPIAQVVEAETYVEIPIEVELQAMDTDNDIVLYQLTEEPRLGTASIQGNILSYSPGAKAGKDKFSYTVVDAEGNTAQAASITINVQKNRAGLTYSDMVGNPAHYAAIYLAENGIMTGESIGGCSFFRPTQTVTRSEFIAMATSIAELPVVPTEQTDFADDGGLSAWAKPFVSTAAASGLINGYQTSGGLSEIRGQNPITLAEASVIINNLLSETMDGLQYTLADTHSDMDWARSAISSLDRLDILSPLASMQSDDSPITRQDACEMLYRAMCLMQR